MASSSNKAVTRGEEDGGQEEQNRTLLDSVKRSGSTDVGCEGREAGGLWETAHYAWTCWCWIIDLCCSPAEPTSDPRWYHSARIQRMMDKSGELNTEVESSKVESEIEASKAHWSEVDRAVAKAKHSAVANRKHYEVLRRRRYVRDRRGQFVSTQLKWIDEEQSVGSVFCGDGYSDEELVVGEKLAEGGQAEIYAASWRGNHNLVVKVFKSGSVLQQLEKQIPPALFNFKFELSSCLKSRKRIFQVKPTTSLRGELRAILLRDGRFAFVMTRCWGDLRRLIDEQMMMHSHNEGPPFPPHMVLDLMFQIADDMRRLHAQNPPIIHHDLKAANVLVDGTIKNEPYLNDLGRYEVSVADYECSVGVVGTGIWRAPEILQKLKDRACVTSIILKEKCDVYSYGMTCYEIVTGRLPYEEFGFVESRELIFRGERPKLPPELNPKVKELIMRCWHFDPRSRPSFTSIWYELRSLVSLRT